MREAIPTLPHTRLHGVVLTLLYVTSLSVQFLCGITLLFLCLPFNFEAI
jgi:hypothetical protein